MIFVFGSNLAGRHGKGAALAARQQYGAIYGKGVGLQGNSYAIPTKDERIHTFPLNVIETYVRDFLEFAKAHPEMTFNVTRIGCGLAGYTDAQIAPMFAGAPENCQLPEGWRGPCEWCKSNHYVGTGQCPNTVLRTDNAESREYWRFVKRTAQEVRESLPEWAKEQQ